jgi:CheY-like chemotaxis protein
MMVSDASSDPTEQTELSRLRSLERDALEALDGGDFVRATKLLVEVVEGYEETGNTLLINSAAYYLGVALAGQGHIDNAVGIWEEIIEHGWDSPAAFSRLVRYYQSRDRPDKVERLFERFQRAATERTGEFFTYPGSDEQEPLEPETAEASSDAGSRRLLIADDEPTICDLVARAVEPDGFTVLRAANGQRALRIILSTQLDVIVLDHLMPGYTGLDVLYRLRAEKIDKPVLMISGRHDAQVIEDSTRLGATWLAKPFDVETFAETVREATRSSDAQTPEG